MPDDLSRAAALADTSALPDFEGLQVVASGIEIPGAAGGLRDPLKIEPQAFAQGDTSHVVLQLVCAKVRHEPIVKDEPGGDQRRVHVMQVAGSTFVSPDLVQDALDEMAKRIIQAKEQAGLGQIPGQTSAWDGDEEAEALSAEHGDGQHAGGLRPGCPDCEAEQDEADDEAGE